MLCCLFIVEGIFCALYFIARKDLNMTQTITTQGSGSGSWKYLVFQRNQQRIRRYYEKHPYATEEEVAYKLHLSSSTIARHKRILREQDAAEQVAAR